jgi:hypothetical protein
MDDMSAFDRQLARVVLQRVGSSRPVNDAAIYAAITATQSPKWRFPSMFSAVKFVAASAVVALFGGVLLTSQLTTQDPAEPSVGVSASPSPSPSASLDPMGTAWATGTVGGGTWVEPSEVTFEDGVIRSRAYRWQNGRITMSDPRLSGTIQDTYGMDVHTGADGDLSAFTVGAGTYRIENEAGSWEGPHIFLNEGGGGFPAVSDTGILVGSGAYEGLSAFLVFDYEQASGPWPVVGAIFPGEMPPVATFE